MKVAFKSLQDDRSGPGTGLLTQIACVSFTRFSVALGCDRNALQVGTTAEDNRL